MKKLFTIFIGIVAILVVLSVAKDALIKIAVEKGSEMFAGLPIKMRSINVGILKTVFNIRDLAVLNPKTFRFNDRVMLDMPEVYVDYNLPAILKRRIHLYEVRINLREFIVVKNEKGKINLDSLKMAQPKKKTSKPQSGSKGGIKISDVQIDVLRIKVDTVIYKDYSQGSVPVVKKFNINIDERYEDISGLSSLANLIIVKPLMKTTISRLADINLNDLKGDVSARLSSVQDKALKAVTGARGKITDSGIPKETVDKLIKSTEELVGKIKLPFGKEE